MCVKYPPEKAFPVGLVQPVNRHSFSDENEQGRKKRGKRRRLIASIDHPEALTSNFHFLRIFKQARLV